MFKDLHTGKNGLASDDALARQKEFGLNLVEASDQMNIFRIVVQQFRSFLVFILLIAALVSYVAGQQTGETTDVWVILSILVINAAVGFFQEYRAEKAIYALQKLSALKATVIRNGITQKIDASLLVPGDIIILAAGDKVPADARLIEESRLEVNESALTGESVSVSKLITITGPQEKSRSKNMLYSGTSLTNGAATAVVVAIGMSTEIGKIAKMLQSTKRDPTPLQIRLEHFGEMLGIGTILVCAIVFVIGIFKYENILDAFMTSVSLAVAAVPEGLPVIVTICLALGVQRMVRKNALIRRLSSVETLGCTDVICTDKTGTLTYNQMTVREIYASGKLIEVSGHGYDPLGSFTYQDGKTADPTDMLMKCAVLCNDASLYKNDAWEITGDPTEGALLVMAKKAGFDKKDLEYDMPRTYENPFDSSRKLMSTVNSRYLFVKGAPDLLLARCTQMIDNGRTKALDAKAKEIILQQNDAMAKKALRVLGFAYKNADDTKEDSLTFLGLCGMIDPPRKEVKDAIEKCKKAGIKVVMITGDHKETAIAVAKELGIGQYAITGDELDTIQNLESSVELISIYARVQPEHKLRIVKALKQRGHVVAMTGDGVNDAPALKGANIGIAMGITGTDVSKETADMILLDDNFTSVVNAVEEGRGIYDNIKKFIMYLMSSNSGEVLTVFLATLIGIYSITNPGTAIPILLPLHLLWINIVTDSFLALALSVEPPEKDIMERLPRKKDEPILNWSSIARIALTAMVMAAGTIYLFKQNLPHGVQYAQTVALNALVVFQLFNVLNCKTSKQSILPRLFGNRWLLAAILGCIAMQLVLIYTPLGAMFNTVPLTASIWLWTTLVGASVVLASELGKFFIRQSERI